MEHGHRTISALIDAGIVYDYASEYGEPGYRSDGPILLGDWWCRRPACKGTELHGVDRHYPRLFAALEEQGFTLEWYDEWYADCEADKVWRTTADSYSWQGSLLWVDGDVLTPDDGLDRWLEEAVDNPRIAFPSHLWSDQELAERGFVERECGFASGWFPGQTDNPEAIAAAIHADYPGAEVLFKLSSVGQFDVHFCVYVRTAEEVDA